ncbi:MAG: hypothetical protein HYX51_00265 [Chloroflexi bacterium]|nr:hypothetical protein [Chloroflexota bacterium]
MNDRGTHNAAGPHSRPLAGGGDGGPTYAEHGHPPDNTPETGTPAFSKGGHLADPPSSERRHGERDPANEEKQRRSSA